MCPRGYLLVRTPPALIWNVLCSSEPRETNSAVLFADARGYPEPFSEHRPAEAFLPGDACSVFLSLEK